MVRRSSSRRVACGLLWLLGGGGCASAPAGTGDRGLPAADAAATDAPGIADAPAGATDAPDRGAPTSGFWRLERPGGSVSRSWLVDPAGQRTFVLGVNTVMRDAKCDGIRERWIRRMDPTAAAHIEWARLATGSSGGRTADKPLGFNSVGAFSDTNDFDDSGGLSYMLRPTAGGGAGAPFAKVLYPSARGVDRALKDEAGTVLLSGVGGTRVGDPFNPAFLADLDALVADDVTPLRELPNLIAYYAGNEAGMFDSAAHGGGVRDFRAWIWSDCPAASTVEQPQCAPHALAAFLRQRYGDDIAALNAKWASSHASFAALVSGATRPVPYVHDCELECRQDLQRFVHGRLLREWVRVVTSRIRAADPHHLVGSPRLALGSAAAFRFWEPAAGASPDKWKDSGQPLPNDNAGVRYCPFDLLARDGDAGFDFVAVNVYTGAAEFERPWFTDGIHKLQGQSGLPVMVSELGVRARISGWSNTGGAWAFVPGSDAIEDQLQRGQHYRSQIEQLVSFREIIGASWHAWSDRYLAADDTTQINMGLVQCDDPPRGHQAGTRWTAATDAIAATNHGIMQIIRSRTGI